LSKVLSKVLIVGGAGYLGGAVVDLLENTDHQVRVYDWLVYQEEYRRDVPFVFGDVRDCERLFPQLKWADVVIWLAAVVGDQACALNPDISDDINRKAVKWLSNNFSGRVIFPSSCSVYGAHDSLLDETSPTNPLSVYAKTKLEAEQYLSGKNSLIFRLGTLFGVGDQFARIRFDLVVNTLTMRAYRDKKITVFGGDQFRRLLHVRDVAQVMVDNIGTEETGIYNLCSQNVRINDLAYQVRNHFPLLDIQRTEMKFEDSRNYRVSADKAINGLGFSPVRTIDDGIRQIKYLLESNRLRNLDNPRYSNEEFLKRFKERN
jgi:nucleoside-diphosphate-sugar epimerase